MLQQSPPQLHITPGIDALFVGPSWMRPALSASSDFSRASSTEYIFILEPRSRSKSAAAFRN
ncbi:MAG: hypothetical protein JW762_12935 [Dehalococcoidales bacterium]|nr:hypothetical protein [Dehalococcoidales bacterium]